MNGNLDYASIMREYESYLLNEEKSRATVDKYLRDVRAFFCFVEKKEITKECVRAYKEFLEEKNYAVRSINSMLASVNSLLGFLGKEACRVKMLRTQKQIYCDENKELTRDEYLRLLEAAKEQR